MARNKVVPMVNPEVAARNKFSAHVQSIAFSLTLSRHMIDLLQMVRDYGFPHLGQHASEEEWAAWKQSRQVTRTAGGLECYVTFMHALERRGLVVCDTSNYHDRKHGKRQVHLSRAGEIVSQLLVESGLMAPAATKAKRNA